MVQVNVSDGGVPKRAVPSARVTRAGVDGDRQREITVHGGPHRAVSILGIEAIERVAAEGNPIGPGTTGENLTVSGFDVSLLPLGTRLHVADELVLEISGRANPCRTIRQASCLPPPTSTGMTMRPPSASWDISGPGISGPAADTTIPS